MSDWIRDARYEGGKAVVYMVPLDDDRHAQLWLPFGLKPEDAKRIVAFLNALVMDDGDE